MRGAPTERRRRLQPPGAAGDSHWWHANRADEKDVVYVPLGPPASAGGGSATGQSAAAVHSKRHPTDGWDVATSPAGEGGGLTMKFHDVGGGGGGSSGDGGGNGDGGFLVYSVPVSNNPDVSGLPHRRPDVDGPLPLQDASEDTASPTVRPRALELVPLVILSSLRPHLATCTARHSSLLRP